MKNNNFIFILVTSILILFSCKKDDVNLKKDFYVDSSIESEVNIFDLISQLELIEIKKESGEVVDLHDVIKIIPNKDKIFIQGGTHEVYLINNEGGLLKNMNKTGFGPDEYREIKDISFNIQNEELYLYDFQKQRFYIFNDKLKFLRVENIGYNFLNFSFLKDNSLVLFTGKHRNKINDSFIDYDLILLDSLRNIKKKSIPFDYEKFPSVRIHGKNPFHNLMDSNSVVFSDIVSDSLYTITSKNIGSTALFKYKEKTLDKAFKTASHQKIIEDLNKDINKFKGYDFFSSIKGITKKSFIYNFSNNGTKSFYVFKSKESLKIKNYSFPKKYSESYYKDLFEIKGVSDNFFYSALYPISLEFIKEELNKSNYPIIGKEKLIDKINKILSNNIEDGNQIIVKFKLKDF